MTFAYAILQTKKSGIDLRCTEPEAIESVAEYVTGLLPSSKVTIHNDPLTGGPMSCRFRKLSGHDLAIGDQIVKHLCQAGWEPFQVDQVEDSYQMHFRRTIEGADAGQRAL
jgi:hypothetical protein